MIQGNDKQQCFCDIYIELSLLINNFIIGGIDGEMFVRGVGLVVYHALVVGGMNASNVPKEDLLLEVNVSCIVHVTCTVHHTGVPTAITFAPHVMVSIC